MPRANLGSNDAKDQQVIFWVHIWLKSSDDESLSGYSLEGKKHQNGGGHESYISSCAPLFFVLLHLLIFPRSSSSLFTKKIFNHCNCILELPELPELFWLSSYWQIWVKRTHFFPMYFSSNKTANWGKKKTKGKCTTIAVTNLPEMQYVSNIGLIGQKKTTRYLLKISCKKNQH